MLEKSFLIDGPALQCQHLFLFVYLICPPPIQPHHPPSNRPNTTSSSPNVRTDPRTVLPLAAGPPARAPLCNWRPLALVPLVFVFVLACLPPKTYQRAGCAHQPCMLPAAQFDYLSLCPPPQPNHTLAGLNGLPAAIFPSSSWLCEREQVVHVHPSLVNLSQQPASRASRGGV